MTAEREKGNVRKGTVAGVCRVRACVPYSEHSRARRRRAMEWRVRGNHGIGLAVCVWSTLAGIVRAAYLAVAGEGLRAGGEGGARTGAGRGWTLYVCTRQRVLRKQAWADLRPGVSAINSYILERAVTRSVQRLLFFFTLYSTI